MIHTHTHAVQYLPISQLKIARQEELTLSPTLTARSDKDHSVTETHCSLSSATKIGTDSEEDTEQAQE